MNPLFREMDYAKRGVVFAKHYVDSGGDGPRSAIATGYSPVSARFSAARLLKSAAVQDAIKKYRAEKSVQIVVPLGHGTREDWEKRLWDIFLLPGVATRGNLNGQLEAGRLLGEANSWLTAKPGTSPSPLDSKVFEFIKKARQRMEKFQGQAMIAAVDVPQPQPLSAKRHKETDDNGNGDFGAVCDPA